MEMDVGLMKLEVGGEGKRVAVTSFDVKVKCEDRENNSRRPRLQIMFVVLGLPFLLLAYCSSSSTQNDYCAINSPGTKVAGTSKLKSSLGTLINSGLDRSHPRKSTCCVRQHVQLRER